MAMMVSRGMWALWALVTFATVPVSFILWWFGGMAMCGSEIYETPPGSVGDSLCNALVDPVAPWATLAALPTLLAAAGGFAGLRLGRRRLFYFSLIAPFVLALVGVQVFLAVF
jgi:hypothetical protein